MPPSPAPPSPIERHLAPGGARVYRLPLRVFPVLEANAYLVVDDGYSALVDVGSGFAPSNEDLATGFAIVRERFGEAVGLDRLDRVVLTHGHIDHYGGLDFVRAHTQAPVAIHAYDRRVIERHAERHVVVAHALARYFRYTGLAGEALEAALALYHGTRAAFTGGPIQDALADGDVIDGRLQAHHVPGHCPGQVVLRLGDLLLSADHVLPATFPHLAPESVTPWTGLAHYLAALDATEALPGVRLTLPGHGDPIADLPRRIGQLRASATRKLDRVRAACGERPHTILELTHLIYPRTVRYEALLALEKVGAYVEHLDQLGELAIANLPDVTADPGAAPRWQLARAAP